MTGRTIFVTGGSSGIGRAVAQHFAARGWRVGLADIDAAGLEATRALLPDGADTYQLDVRDRAGWAAALEAFTTANGRLDVLFNNAGVPVGGPFAATPFDAIDRVVAVNLMGVVNGAHIGHRFLKATPGSCLLNTASAAALYGTPDAAIYSATKFAVRGLTEALDLEWRRDGIRVRSLMPSFIDTPLLEQHAVASNQSIRERVAARGLEITPVEAVAEAAWRAVHGRAVHTVVGRTARRLQWLSRWAPGLIRKAARG